MNESESVQTFTASTRSVRIELIKLDKNDNIGGGERLPTIKQVVGIDAGHEDIRRA